MLTLHHISKTYGIQTILEDISFSISDGQRLGLIGPNGCGKSTLLRILAGLESPDSGTFTPTRPDLRIGYLAQGLAPSEDQTLQSMLQPEIPKPDQLDAEIASLASALASHPNDPDLQASYDSALTRLSASTLPLSDVLGPLGLSHLPLDLPVSHLSGGQKTRLLLARVLLEKPHLLLLDEPTNHLDLEMLEWLEGWLSGFDGAALIVSHDRTFLDHTVQTILDLNPETHHIRTYPGNYSAYLEQYLKGQSKQWAAYRDQQAEIRRIRQDIARTKEQARGVEITTTSRQPGVRRIAKKVAAKAKSREKKLERYLASEERLEKPKPSWQMKLEFEASLDLSRNVLITNGLFVGYDPQHPLIQDLNLRILPGRRIALTGPNGSGKTSLLRTLVGRLPPLAGTLRLGANVKPGYMAQEQELLDPSLSPLHTIQQVSQLSETEARHFLHLFLFSGDDALRPSRELSFGERARLQLGLLVARGCNFLLLDEPINHLDIPSRSRFEQALSSFHGAVLAVVHDRYFIERFASDVWTLSEGKLHFT